MKTSRLSSKGQVTIPIEVRQAIGLEPGDLVGYEVKDGIVTLQRAEPFDGAFHAALSTTPTEWSSPEDEKAFRDL
jgi:AbrB family looped-hinge helix DNA binding protein